MINDLLVKTLGLAPFSFQSKTLMNKISRQKATTDILKALGFSAVCAHDVSEQFYRWTPVASVDLGDKMADEDVYSISSEACADKMPMCFKGAIYNFQKVGVWVQVLGTSVALNARKQKFGYWKIFL